jgi:DNA polymerase V
MEALPADPIAFRARPEALGPDDAGELLKERLVPRPLTTFLLRVGSDALADEGIQAEDILVVDRSLTAAVGEVVVAAQGGRLVARRLAQAGQDPRLAADADAGEDAPITLWGVVTAVVRPLRSTGVPGR